jgi:lysophospholipase L1-like esterase
MLECLILGDSIAVGTQQFRPECGIIAKSGINSQQWRQKYLQSDAGALPEAKTVIISLGSNDHKNVRTVRELQEIRRNVRAERVVWILPHGNNPASGTDIGWLQTFVKVVAGENNDVVLPITSVEKDNVHPTRAGYQELAEQTKNAKPRRLF